jgi:hypothetical protein
MKLCYVILIILIFYLWLFFILLWFNLFLKIYYFLSFNNLSFFWSIFILWSHLFQWNWLILWIYSWILILLEILLRKRVCSSFLQKIMLHKTRWTITGELRLIESESTRLSKRFNIIFFSAPIGFIIWTIDWANRFPHYNFILVLDKMV